MSTEWLLRRSTTPAQLGPGRHRVGGPTRAVPRPAGGLSGRATPGARQGRRPRGGFRLARPASEIMLLQIVEAVDGASPPHDCRGIRRQGGGAPFPELCRTVRGAIHASGSRPIRSRSAASRASFLVRRYVKALTLSVCARCSRRSCTCPAVRRRQSSGTASTVANARRPAGCVSRHFVFERARRSGSIRGTRNHGLRSTSGVANNRGTE